MPSTLRGRLSAAAVAALAIVLILVLWLRSGGDETEEEPAAAPATVEPIAGGADLTALVDGWLDPAEEIVVGAHRYVQPCRLVTVDDLIGIAGDLTGLETRETILDEAFLTAEEAHDGHTVVSYCQRYSREFSATVSSEQFASQ